MLPLVGKSFICFILLETMDYIQTFKRNNKYEDAFRIIQELLKVGTIIIIKDIFKKT